MTAALAADAAAEASAWWPRAHPKPRSSALLAVDPGPTLAAGRAGRQDPAPDARATLARIVPGMRPRRSAPPAEQWESDGERFRMADEIATLLLDGARAGWRLLILDDLHAADTSSLEVLGHLAGRLGSGPLLVVGAHRDTAIEVTPALQGLLARVSRGAHAADPPAGLDWLAVQQQLNSILGRSARPLEYREKAGEDLGPSLLRQQHGAIEQDDTRGASASSARLQRHRPAVPDQDGPGHAGRVAHRNHVDRRVDYAERC